MITSTRVPVRCSCIKPTSSWRWGRGRLYLSTFSWTDIQKIHTHCISCALSLWLTEVTQVSRMKPRLCRLMLTFCVHFLKLLLFSFFNKGEAALFTDCVWTRQSSWSSYKHCCGARGSFGEEIQTENFYIYNITDVMIQTQKYLYWTNQLSLEEKKC